MTTPALLRPIANRADNGTFKLPDDGYYQVVPYGQFLHKPTGLVQVVDDKARDAILNSFQADKVKKAKVEDTGILLADYDHFSNDPDQSSEAAGWIEDLQNRVDGLYAKIRWTPTGEKAVTGGDFRYISPVWKPDEVESIDNKTIRPLRLDRVGLTNDPNMKGMRPLSNRAEQEKPKMEVITISARGAELRAEIKSFLNAGTSAGAKKGWETRRANAGFKGKSGMAKAVERKGPSLEEKAQGIRVKGGRVKWEKVGKNELGGPGDGKGNGVYHIMKRSGHYKMNHEGTDGTVTGMGHSTRKADLYKAAEAHAALKPAEKARLKVDPVSHEQKQELAGTAKTQAKPKSGFFSRLIDAVSRPHVHDGGAE